MYYFLAIISQDDVLRGNFVPSYVLCASHGGAEARSSFRIVQQNSVYKDNPKMLFTTVDGNDAYIDFMSAYRAREHQKEAAHDKRKNTLKYYPKGILAYFPCDEQGNVVGPAIFVRRVPVKNLGEDQGKNRFEEQMNKKPSPKDLLTGGDGFDVAQRKM